MGYTKWDLVVLDHKTYDLFVFNLKFDMVISDLTGI